MRSSARTTEQRGFTLLEVVIATSLFAVVMVIALAQLNETTEAAKLSTHQADLRRQGEKLLADIVKDLRSAPALYASADSRSIEFAKQVDFDSTAQLPILQGGGAPIGATTVLYRYSQPPASAATVGGNPWNGYLQLDYGPRSAFTGGTTFGTSLALELALLGDQMPTPAGPVSVNGLTVSATPGPLPGIFTASGGAFADAPQAVSIKLVFKRRLGKTAGFNDQFVWVTVDTTVNLKPSKNY